MSPIPLPLLASRAREVIANLRLRVKWLEQKLDGLEPSQEQIIRVLGHLHVPNILSIITAYDRLVEENKALKASTGKFVGLASSGNTFVCDPSKQASSSVMRAGLKGHCNLSALLWAIGIIASVGEAKRKIAEGAVRINGTVIRDVECVFYYYYRTKISVGARELTIEPFDLWN